MFEFGKVGQVIVFPFGSSFDRRLNCSSPYFSHPTEEIKNETQLSTMQKTLQGSLPVRRVNRSGSKEKRVGISRPPAGRVSRRAHVFCRSHEDALISTAGGKSRRNKRDWQFISKITRRLSTIPRWPSTYKRVSTDLWLQVESLFYIDCGHSSRLSCRISGIIIWLIRSSSLELLWVMLCYGPTSSWLNEDPGLLIHESREKVSRKCGCKRKK